MVVFVDMYSLGNNKSVLLIEKDGIVKAIQVDDKKLLNTKYVDEIILNAEEYYGSQTKEEGQ